ncbi:peptidylprolyl isomerase [Candidatus Woesearchaeota archaeon]|nr:peptidylprolyl isomerase [Candidatus Woesearchaeota archaeon]
MPVKNGDKIKVDYTGSLEDGTIFDSSEKAGHPIEVEIGAHKVIKGFEDALLNMKKGEEKEVTLPSDMAYGDPNPQLLKKVPKDQLPKEQELKPGMMLAVSLPNGMQLPAKIVEVGDTEVTLDLNHPLAGKTLKFKLKVVDIL